MAKVLLTGNHCFLSCTHLMRCGGGEMGRGRGVLVAMMWGGPLCRRMGHPRRRPAWLWWPFVGGLWVGWGRSWGAPAACRGEHGD